MKQRKEEEIERMDALFREIGATEPVIPLTVRDAREMNKGQHTRNEFPFSDFCQKFTYPSDAVARRIALQREKKGARPLRVYKCDRCRGFHLSSFIDKR